ncbi:HupE/UreJ family protein [Pseudooceanicola sp. MF1-13]|uniref:HupE/UreJ family protein n=1 Tax=Pseudooceanicola sp. MF1-13 TaxID=3379095 RepID=UPI003891AE2B
MKVLNVMRTKLRFGRGLSRAVALGVAVVMAGVAGQGRAHEVLPTIIQLSTEGQDVRLEMRMNAEAFVAGIDLDGLKDTNTSDRSDIYDDLRALPSDEMADRIRNSWPEISQGMILSADGTDIPLSLRDIEVSEVGNVDLARPSRVILTGEMPDSTKALTLTWPDGHGTLALRHTGVEDGYAGYLDGGETSEPITLQGGQAATGLQAFVQYIPIGFDHILPKGLDHILFVLGLFFLSPTLRPLLWQISAFTLAHTVTLALGALGVVNVPGSIVEPLIAASIAFIAIENIFATGLTRWRPFVVFGFGLLHGLGFASVLQEFGLPQDQFIPALIGFNVGVELGQLTVIALAFLAVGAWFRHKTWYRPGIAIPASAVIACIGLYWAVERTFL